LLKTKSQNEPVWSSVNVLDLTVQQINDELTKIIDIKKKDLPPEKLKQLKKSRASAKNLLKIIETKKSFLEVLRTPFYFTTALEVFDKPSFEEKELPTDSKKIREFLLDSFVEDKTGFAKLKEFKNNKGKIKKWLKSLALLMEKKQSVTFELADLQKEDTERLYFGVTTGSVIGGFMSFFFTGILLFIPLIKNDYEGAPPLASLVLFIIYSFFIYGLIGGLIMSFRKMEIKTEDKVTINFSGLLNFDTWLIGGIIFGTPLGGVTGFSYSSPLLGLGTFILIIIFMLLLREVLDPSEIKKIKFFAYLKSPYQRLVGGLYINLIFAIISSLIIVLSQYISDCGFVISIFFAILTYRALVKIVLLRHFLVRFSLWLEDSAPFKYATFLNYAAQARILEKDGGHWRFRHQYLQEYFADLDEQN
jgi:hypothetical protein